MEGMAMLALSAETISPVSRTTASPVDTSVATQRKGIENFEKSLMLYTGRNSSENFSQSSWPSMTPVEKRNQWLTQGSSISYLPYSSFSSMIMLRILDWLERMRSQSIRLAIFSMESAE